MQYDKSEMFAAAILPKINELVAACAAAGVPIMVEACYMAKEDENGEYEAGLCHAGYMPKEITPIQMAIGAAVSTASPERTQAAYDALTGKALAEHLYARVEAEVRSQVERLMSKFN